MKFSHWRIITHDIVNVLSDQHVLKEHWVYKVKCDAHGQVSHYKAHWVVKGYKQQFDIDYDQTFCVCQAADV
jgi:hypothetical protein